MLTYSFEHLDGIPLYEHLYHCIRQDIETGALKPGEKLPSKRALARHLGISTITVEGAYGQLVAEGYCTSQPKRGYYVTDNLPANLGVRSLSAGGIPSGKVRPAGVKIPEETPPASRSSSLARGDELRSPRSDRLPREQGTSSAPRGEGASFHFDIDFAEGGGKAVNFPFSLWTKLLRCVVAEEAGALLARSPGQGVLALREAIAAHLLRFRGLAVTPEQIVVGAGTEYLYGLLVQFFGRSRRFCVENPGYGRIKRIYESCGARCLLAGLDDAGVVPGELVRQGAEIVHISPSHHYPTGLIMPISRRYELLGWAAASSDRFIIEDDYDSEFRLTGRPIPTLMGIDATGCVLYMNTFSKSLTPTIRISYLVLPSRLVQPFREKLGFYSCTVSNFEQYTLARFLAEGHFERHIHRMRTLYRRRRETILTLLKHAPFADRIDIQEQGSGLHFLVRFRAAGETAAIERKLAAAGIRMRPLAACYMADSAGTADGDRAAAGGARPADGADTATDGSAGDTDRGANKTPRLPEELQGVFVLDYSSVGEAQMRDAVGRIGRALYEEE